MGVDSGIQRHLRDGQRCVGRGTVALRLYVSRYFRCGIRATKTLQHADCRTSKGVYVVLRFQFICQAAGGSGIPEVIGFLNGTVMRHVLNLPAFCVKFFSCSCAVGAGLPVGPEGPMIHIGYRRT